MDGFTWTQFGILISLVGLVITLAAGAWKQRSSDIRAIHERIEGVKDKLTAALNDFKIEVARDYPTARALAASEERLTSAINKLTERIDRWLERHP